MAAVDTTGLETRHASAHYRYRYTERYQQSYRALHRGRAPAAPHARSLHPKLAVAVHTSTHLIAGALPTWGPSNDSPLLPQVLRQAGSLLRFHAAVADAGFDAESNHRTLREALGLVQTAIRLNLRGRGTRRPRTPYRREMEADFPQALYRERLQVESTFSQQKRRLGSALSARRRATQEGEMLLRVLTHNLLLLYCAFPLPFNTAGERVRG